MNRALPFCIVAALALVAGGCATTSEPTAAYVPPPPPASGPVIEQDAAYIQRVEQIALRRGISVTWVNPPSKRKGFSRR